MPLWAEKLGRHFWFRHSLTASPSQSRYRSTALPKGEVALRSNDGEGHPPTQSNYTKKYTILVTYSEHDKNT